MKNMTQLVSPRCTYDAATRQSTAVFRYAADARGNVAIITALSFSLLIAAAGGAVDFARAYHAQNSSQGVMDAAVLAAGRVLQTTQSESEAIAAGSSYFETMKSPLLSGLPASFTIEDNKTVVRGVLASKVDTLLLGALNISELPVRIEAYSALSGGSSTGTNYEISLMLDVTGSMCDDGIGPCTSGTKVTALKAAATDLINIAVWDNQGTYTSRVAIVPFATRVRIAPDGAAGPIMKQLTNLDPTWNGWVEYCSTYTGGGGSEGNGNFSCTATAVTYTANQAVLSCVTDRTGPQEFTDASPGANTWLVGHGGNRFPFSYDSSNTPITTGLGGTQSDPAGQWNFGGGGGCADIDSTNEILPLTSDKSVLKARINGLSAFGSTAGALGTAWSWYMLSPNFDHIWTGQSRPASYGDLTEFHDGRPKLKKIAILMTDGEYNTYRGNKDTDPALVSANAQAICQNMKAKGIEIYTVGFGLDQLPGSKRAIAEATLKNCGSDIQHFYNALNVEELKGAFRDIAIKLAVLRLKK